MAEARQEGNSDGSSGLMLAFITLAGCCETPLSKSAE